MCGVQLREGEHSEPMQKIEFPEGLKSMRTTAYGMTDSTGFQ